MNDDSENQPSRNERIEALVRAFIETASAALRNADARRPGGQHVSYHGDFASLGPGAASDLRRWERDFRAALDAPGAISPKKLSFADQINFFSAEQGITRTELARRLRLTLPRISQMLRPDWNPTWKTLERVADALGYEIRVEWRRKLRR